MAASAVKVIVVDGKEITQSVDLRTAKQGAATKVKAIKGGKFILAEADTGAAPENITAHRVGNDLHVSLQGTGIDDPDLIIEGYYSEQGQGEQLVGVAEDGAYYEYIASDAEADHEAGMLGEGVSSPLVLGRNPLLGFGSGLVPAAGLSWLGLGLFGLGALGLIGAALHDSGNGGGLPGGGGNPGDGGGNGGKLVIGDVIDNVGAITGSIRPGGITDDSTPTIIGSGGTPGKVVTIVDETGKPIGSTIVGEDGNWQITPEVPLPDGEHTIIVIEDGKEPSDGREIIVDTKAPDQASIDSVFDDAGSVTGFLANPAMTDDTTPTLNGKAEANSTVRVYDNGTLIGSTTADADGNWTLTPATALPDGDHTFTATATDAAGNVGLPSAPWTVTVDTFEGKPAIGHVIDDFGPSTGPIPNPGTTDDNTPTIGGDRLTPGSTVIISDGGTPIGSTIVRDDGSWEFTPPPLDDGKHDFTVVVTDPVGNISEPSDPWTVIIDTVAPNAPLITQVIDDQGAVTGPLTSGVGTTDDARPEIRGTAEANSIVTIFDGDRVLGTAQVNGEGNWSFTPPFPLDLGQHHLTAKATDAAGNVSDASNQFDLDLVTGGVPTSPAIIGVIDDDGATPVTVAQNGFTNDNTPVVIGTAPAGSLVMLYVDGNPVAIGSIVAQPDGSWSIPVTTPLLDGLHNFTATATIGGVPSVPTGEYPINIDTMAPAASTDMHLIDDVGPVTGEITDTNPVTTTDDANPTYSGRAEPGTIVYVYDNGGATPIGSAQVQPDGSWTFEPATPLADGPHEFTNQVVDQAGNMSPVSAPTHFIVETGAVAISITEVDDNKGDITGPIQNNGAPTDDNTPTIHGTATANSLVHIYVDGNATPIGSVRADASGNWVFTPAEPGLADGAHTITATSTNAAGVVSDSNEFNLTIDTTAPLQADIGYVSDDVGPIQGPVEKEGTTDDTTPTIGGGGLTPGDKVTIIDNGEPIGTAIVGDGGNWEFTPTTPLNPGDHDFTVIVTDPAGNKSPESDPWPITIDTTPPVAPVITMIIDDQGAVTGDMIGAGLHTTDDARPEIRGTAEANSIVTIYDGATVLGTAVTQEDGSWSFTPPFPLGLGDHNLVAKATDKAGNVSDPSNDYDLTVATGGVPPAPAIIGVIDDDGATSVTVVQNGFTNDNTPVVIGTAPAGSLVMLYVDGNPVAIGSIVAQPDGSWSIPVTTPLLDGLHNFTATATIGGVPSVPTGEYPINIDTMAPAASTDLNLLDDIGPVTGEITDTNPVTTTDDANPAYSGKAEPGATVIIYDQGREIARVPVNGSGDWSYTPATPLADGPHEFTNQVVDQAGNMSPVSAPIHFNVDTGAVTIAITQVDDNKGDITGPILDNGAPTDDNTPTIHGTATANSLVHIYVDGNPVAIGSVTADSFGNWVFTPAEPGLADGAHTITATSTNAAGVVSDSNEFNLTIDTTAPLQADIGYVSDDVGPIQGPVEKEGTTDDTTPTIGGGGLTPGDKVTIIDNGEPIGTAIVGDDGNWEFTPTTPLNPGDHDFTVIVTDPAGNKSPESDPWPITIDIDAPVAPVINGYLDDVAPGTGNIASGGFTNDRQPLLSGTGEIGATVTIRDGATVLGTAVVQPNGSWSLQVASDLAAGAHNFIATQNDRAGNPSLDSNTYSVTVDFTPPVVAITGAADNAGPNHSNVPSGGTSDDPTPTLSGTGEANRMVTVYDGTTFVGTAMADGSGNWTLPVATALGTGIHHFTAVQTDAAGNVGTSPNYDFNYQPLVTTTLGEDFNGVALSDFGTANQSFNSGGMNFSVYGQSPLQTTGHNGIIRDSADTQSNGTNSLGTNGDVDVSILNGGVATGLSVLVGNINTNSAGDSRIDLLDSGGNVIRSIPILTQPGPFFAAQQQIDIDLPEGVYYHSFRLVSGTINGGTSEWRTYDNIVVRGASYPTAGTFGAEEAVQDDSSTLTHASVSGDDQGSSYDALLSGTEKIGQGDANTTAQVAADSKGPDASDHAAASSEQSFVLHEAVKVHVEEAGDSPVLVLEGANQVLDLSALTAVEQAKVGEAKVIDITGTGDNTLNLNLGDVLEQGGKGLFMDDGKTQMMVKGDAGDVVNLDHLLADGSAGGDWTQAAGSVTVEGVAYNVFQNTGLEAELLVQQGVTTNLV